MSLAKLPDYEFLPAPLWLLTALHVLTLTLHFVAMNFLLGGTVILLIGKFQDKWSHPTVGRFVKLFPTAMAAAVTLGVAPLLFAQLVYGRMLYSASIVSAWFWILIPLSAIVTYYFFYAAAFAKAGNPRIRTFLLVALAGLLYISLTYSSVFSLAERPETQASLYAENQSGLAIHADVGFWGVRWLHMVFGAVTLGGFFVGLLGRKDDGAFATGKTFFLWGMVLSMVIGLAYLLTLGDMLKPFMRSPAIWYLMVSILLSLGSLHFFFQRRFVASGAMLFLSLLGMVAIRHDLRLLRLEGKFDPADVPVNPQWGLFLIFLVCFVVALGLVAYMLRLFFRERTAAEA